MDITDSLTSIINILVQVVTWCFNTLDNITFFGTSVLRFFIAIVVLSVVLDLMFTLVKSRGSREVRSNKGSAKSE